MPKQNLDAQPHLPNPLFHRLAGDGEITERLMKKVLKVIQGDVFATLFHVIEDVAGEIRQVGRRADR